MSETSSPFLLSESDCLSLAEQVQSINLLWKWAGDSTTLTPLASLLRSAKDDAQLLLLRYAGEKVALTVDDAETAKAAGSVIYSLSLVPSGRTVCHIPESVLARRGRNSIFTD